MCAGRERHDAAAPPPIDLAFFFITRKKKKRDKESEHRGNKSDTLAHSEENIRNMEERVHVEVCGATRTGECASRTIAA
jgi:hypothetical protein